MKIALAQIKCAPGDIKLNVRTMTKYIHAAAAAGCDIVAFPEMCDTGYHMPTIAKTASSWECGPFVEVSGATADAKITVIAGLSERVDSHIYNSVAVIGPDGRLIEKYRKTHLITAKPVCEQNYISPGDRLVSCNVNGFQIGLMTCYDIRFPEMARRLALSGVEILVVPAAWPLPRLRHWEVINACRAIENQAYVAAVNRVGDDEGLAFGGSSRLIDPYGTLMASASEIDEALITGEVSKERLAEVRGRMKVYEDRRNDLY